MSKPIKRGHDRADADAHPPDGQPDPGYDTLLAEKIKAGCVELDARKGVPAGRVWRDPGVV